MTDVAIISRISQDTRSLGFLTLPQMNHCVTFNSKVRNPFKLVLHDRSVRIYRYDHSIVQLVDRSAAVDHAYTVYSFLKDRHIRLTWI